VPFRVFRGLTQAVYATKQEIFSCLFVSFVVWQAVYATKHTKQKTGT